MMLPPAMLSHCTAHNPKTILDFSHLGTSMSPILETRSFGELQSRAGSGLTILTNPADPRFQEHSKRWSNIDRQTPAAIVLPRSEEQIQSTVSHRPPVWASFRGVFVTNPVYSL